MKAFTRWIVAHSVALVWAGAILTLISAACTVLLYKNLRTDMEELLPTTARSVVDLNEIKERLNSSSNLAILVFSKHPRESKRFVEDLAGRIETSNNPHVARVEYRITREIEFFKKRRTLFLKLDDLKRVRRYVRDRIDYEKKLYNPLNIFSEVEIPEPTLNFKLLENRYAKEVSNYTHFPEGYYANPDETIRVLLVYMAGKSSGIESARKLREFIDQTISQLNPASYAPDIEIRYTGDVQNLVEEHASLIADLEFTSIVVFILCSLAILVFYGNLMACVALVTSLLSGTLLTFAVSYFIVGYLNANSAFLGSIVLGNGVNFGIIVLARYMEERQKGRIHVDALETSLTGTRTATLTAALAAGLAYGSLMLTGFRGFRQFGLIGFIGMLLCWLSAFTLLPALLSAIDRWRPRALLPAPFKSKHRRHFSDWVAAFVDRFPKSIAIGTVVLSILSVLAIRNYRGEIIQTDTSKLRDKKSMESGSGYNSKYLNEIFRRYISPLAILPKTAAEAELIRKKLEDVSENSEIKGFIAAVYSPEDLVPDQQPAKIAVLRDIRKLLKPKILNRLSKSDRDRANEFLQTESFHPFTIHDLPGSIQERFKERDGSLGRIILVEPVLDPAIINNGDNQTKLIHKLREVVDSVHPGTPIAGQLPITVDMYEAVRRDGPKATLFAFIGVVILVFVLFREVKAATQALISLLIGVLWFAGIITNWDLKINFLNFIALPITFGIGVDYGVNVFQRYRLDPTGGISRVIRSTGGAVILASLTTIIGYGSLLMAGNRAFVSFGRIAIIGEITCLCAAILAMPAILNSISKRPRQKKRGASVQELQFPTVGTERKKAG